MAEVASPPPGIEGGKEIERGKKDRSFGLLFFLFLLLLRGGKVIVVLARVELDRDARGRLFVH